MEEKLFYKNWLIELVANSLQYVEPDWKYIKFKIKKSHSVTYDMHNTYNEEYDINHRKGVAAEIQVRKALEEIARDSFFSDIMTENPISCHAESSNYEFYETDRGCIEVRYKSDKRVHSEIDALFFIRNIPVLVEVKLRRTHGSSSSKQVSSGGLNQLLKNHEYLAEKIKPIKELYCADKVGFVMVVYPHCINEYFGVQESFSGAQESFR